MASPQRLLVRRPAGHRDSPGLIRPVQLPGKGWLCRVRCSWNFVVVGLRYRAGMIGS